MSVAVFFSCNFFVKWYKNLVIIVSILFTTAIYGQSFSVGSLIKNISQSGNITGLVKDTMNNNLPMAFVDVTIEKSNISTSTNIEGVFTLKLKPGTYVLKISFIGYKTILVKDVVVVSNQTTKISHCSTSITYSDHHQTLVYLKKIKKT